MKRVLIMLFILTLSVMFTACGSSSDSDQGTEDEVTSEVTDESEDNEEIDDETEDETPEKVEVTVVSGGTYTDKSTGAITLDVLDGYIANEDKMYNTEETLATVTVIPQEAASEVFTTFMMVQIVATEEAEADAKDYLDMYVSDVEGLEEIQLAGFNGFMAGTSDEISGWLNEYYVLVGPRTVDGGFNFMVIIWALGLDSAYVEDMHEMIYSLEFDFTKL